MSTDHTLHSYWDTTVTTTPLKFSTHSNVIKYAGIRKLDSIGYDVAVIASRSSSKVVLTQYLHVTDGQTDTQTNQTGTSSPHSTCLYCATVMNNKNKILY